MDGMNEARAQITLRKKAFQIHPFSSSCSFSRAAFRHRNSLCCRQPTTIIARKSIYEFVNLPQFLFHVLFHHPIAVACLFHQFMCPQIAFNNIKGENDVNCFANLPSCSLASCSYCLHRKKEQRVFNISC